MGCEYITFIAISNEDFENLSEVERRKLKYICRGFQEENEMSELFFTFNIWRNNCPLTDEIAVHICEMFPELPFVFITMDEESNVTERYVTNDQVEVKQYSYSHFGDREDNVDSIICYMIDKELADISDYFHYDCYMERRKTVLKLRDEQSKE